MIFFRLRTLRLNTALTRTRYSTLSVYRNVEYVAEVRINRPQKSNAMNRLFFEEIKAFFKESNGDNTIRAVVLTAEGKNFSAGIDLEDFRDFFLPPVEVNVDAAKKSKALIDEISGLQGSFQSVVNCSVPVICAIQGACVGGGVDLILAADIRLCERKTTFCVKEVDLGICPDLGTIQYLPSAVGSSSLARELIYTARIMDAAEAESCGLVSKCTKDADSLRAAAMEIAKCIAKKSPIAIRGSKIHLNYARDHSVEDSLNYQKIWNASMLQGSDVAISAKAFFERADPKYPHF